MFWYPLKCAHRTLNIVSFLYSLTWSMQNFVQLFFKSRRLKYRTEYKCRSTETYSKVDDIFWNVIYTKLNRGTFENPTLNCGTDVR